jgi:hypothetical protein
MARDASLFVRRAVIAAAKAGPNISAIVDNRFYGPKPR